MSCDPDATAAIKVANEESGPLVNTNTKPPAKKRSKPSKPTSTTTTEDNPTNPATEGNIDKKSNEKSDDNGKKGDKGENNSANEESSDGKDDGKDDGKCTGKKTVNRKRKPISAPTDEINYNDELVVTKEETTRKRPATVSEKRGPDAHVTKYKCAECQRVWETQGRAGFCAANCHACNWPVYFVTLQAARDYIRASPKYCTSCKTTCCKCGVVLQPTICDIDDNVSPGVESNDDEY